MRPTGDDRDGRGGGVLTEKKKDRCQIQQPLFQKLADFLKK
jgi:hypothetical protein